MHRLNRANATIQYRGYIPASDLTTRERCCFEGKEKRKKRMSSHDHDVVSLPWDKSQARIKR